MARETSQGLAGAGSGPVLGQSRRPSRLAAAVGVFAVEPGASVAAP
jgi:hypothetical protein